MLFHPDDGKTIEEIIQWEWEHKFSAELKAYVLGLAD
jgi:hypothetical protein